MEKFYYRRLDVYQNIKQLITEVYRIANTFPREEKYALGDQIRRAVTSIASNLAEGFGRYSDKERLYFLSNANGSLMEVSCQIEIAHDLAYIPQEEKDSLDDLMVIITKQLTNLRSRIDNSSSNNDKK